MSNIYTLSHIKNKIDIHGTAAQKTKIAELINKTNAYAQETKSDSIKTVAGTFATTIIPELVDYLTPETSPWLKGIFYLAMCYGAGELGAYLLNVPHSTDPSIDFGNTCFESKWDVEKSTPQFLQQLEANVANLNNKATDARTARYLQPVVAGAARLLASSLPIFNNSNYKFMAQSMFPMVASLGVNAIYPIEFLRQQPPRQTR